jgi:hypothetical protein
MTFRADDAFDTVMDSLISVWRKGGSYDIYGIESQDYTLLLIDVPCRYDPGPGQEERSHAGFGKQKYKFYTRPLMVDEPPIPLTIHHWLQINNARGTFVLNPEPTGMMFDVENIKNVADHHLEIEALLIEP